MNMNNKRSDLMITGSASQLDLNALYNLTTGQQGQSPMEQPIPAMNTAPITTEGFPHVSVQQTPTFQTSGQLAPGQIQMFQQAKASESHLFPQEHTRNNPFQMAQQFSQQTTHPFPQQVMQQQEFPQLNVNHQQPFPVNNSQLSPFFPQVMAQHSQVQHQIQSYTQGQMTPHREEPTIQQNPQQTPFQEQQITYLRQAEEGPTSNNVAKTSPATSSALPQINPGDNLMNIPVFSGAPSDEMDLSIFRKNEESFTSKLDSIKPSDPPLTSPAATVEVEENKEEKRFKKGIFRWPKRNSESSSQPSAEDSKAIIASTSDLQTINDNKNYTAEIKGRMGNEQKFMGEGQMFKGKLIGVLEVQNARGDRMCQDALQELKIAVKASGEHKQRVIIHIAVDGLKIRDEKNGDCLYHHPVHKISFIAQDMADSRAFGYIYGSPENGHRFFGIKTEKAAAQVVVSMRDLFQVVFDLKQQEIEQTKKQLDTTSLTGVQHKKEEANKKPDVVSGTTPSNIHSEALGSADIGEPSMDNKGALSDLLGLQSELTNIQAGIRQIDKIAPTAPMSFQTDSMIPIGSRLSTGIPHQPTQSHVSNDGTISKHPQAIMSANPPNMASGSDAFGAAPFLPPPPSKSGGRSRPIAVSGNEPIYGSHEQQNTPPMHSASPMIQNNSNQLKHPEHLQPNKHGAMSNVNLLNNSMASFSAADKYQVLESLDRSNPQPCFTSHTPQTNVTNAFNQGSVEHNNFSRFINTTPDPLQEQQSRGMTRDESFERSVRIPQFTDLDPLGTGKSKPYLDRKDFFSELKAHSPRLNEVTGTSSPGSDVLSSSVGSLSGLGAFGESSKAPPNSFSDNFTADSPSMWHCGRPSDHSSLSKHAVSSHRTNENSPSSNYGHLKVTLPPEDSGRTYGTIPHLEASPRRYRRDILPTTTVAVIPSTVSLGVPPLYTTTKSVCDHHQDSPSQDIPPKLPERPPKTSCISPPPLPPKKPLSQQNSWKMTSSVTIPPVRSDNIYDFPPDPPPTTNTVSNDTSSSSIVTMEELSKMSVMELNDKMTSGKLPSHLQGMSIIELVNFISHETKAHSQQITQSNLEHNCVKEDEFKYPSVETEMKPSFSDNFVSQSLNHSNYCKAVESNVLPENRVEAHSFESSGFEDDFNTQFPPEKEYKSKDSNYDKYAVLRELALEDEILRAWKSPSDPEDEDDPISEAQNNLEDDTKEDSDFNDDGDSNSQSVSDQEEKELSDEESQEDKETRQYFEPPPVCSSEGSPCSRSESEDNEKFDDDDDDDDERPSMEDELVVVNAEENADRKRDSQVPLCDEESFRCPSNTQFDDNFLDTFGSSDPVVNNPGGWTTFEEDLPTSPSAKAQRNKKDDESTRTTNNWEGESHSRDYSCNKFRFRHYSSRYADDGFESSDSSSRYVSLPRNDQIRSGERRHREEKTKESQCQEENSDRCPSPTEYSYTPNPFNDNFIPPSNEDPGSNDEVLSSSLIIEDNERDIFESANILDDANFKVTAKVSSSSANFPKSDSINIFEIREDPFDDDFFK